MWFRFHRFFRASSSISVYYLNASLNTSSVMTTSDISLSPSCFGQLHRKVCDDKLSFSSFFAV
jgi:hypothetical protein